MPELCFINDKKTLCDELINYIMKDIKNCVYNPNLTTSMDLGYLSKHKERFTINQSDYKGILKFEERLIILSNKRENNLNIDNIIKILQKFQMNFEIDYNDRPNLYVENFSEKIKTLKYSK